MWLLDSKLENSHGEQKHDKGRLTSYEDDLGFFPPVPVIYYSFLFSFKHSATVNAGNKDRMDR